MDSVAADSFGVCTHKRSHSVKPPTFADNLPRLHRSGTQRAMADLRGEFRRTSDGTTRPAGMSVLGAGRHLSADAVITGQQRMGAASVGPASGHAATSDKSLQVSVLRPRVCWRP